MVPKHDIFGSQGLKESILDVAIGTALNTNCLIILGQALKFKTRVDLLKNNIMKLQEGKDNFPAENPNHIFSLQMIQLI